MKAEQPAVNDSNLYDTYRGKKTSSQQASCMSEVTTQRIQCDSSGEEMLRTQRESRSVLQEIHKMNACLYYINLEIY